MINIMLVIDKNEVLRLLDVSGHSGYSVEGSDIVCSAVSLLIEASYVTFYNSIGDKVQKVDDTDYQLSVVSYFSTDVQILKGATLVLLSGLQILSKKYSKYIDIQFYQGD